MAETALSSSSTPTSVTYVVTTTDSALTLMRRILYRGPQPLVLVQRSLICIYSRSPSLASPPELPLLSDQQWH